MMKPSGILAAPKEEIVSMVSHYSTHLETLSEAAFTKSMAYEAIDWSQMSTNLKTVSAFFNDNKWSIAFIANQEPLVKAFKNVKEASSLLKDLYALPDQFAVDEHGCSNVLSLGIQAKGKADTIEWLFNKWSEAMEAQIHLFKEVQKAAQVATALKE